MTVEKMKKNPKGPGKGSRPLFEEEAKKSDFQALIEHAQANPMLYAAAAVIVILSVLAGVFYRLNSEGKRQEFMTSYAKAVESEDPALRVTALEGLSTDKGDLAAYAVYMLGESAYDAQQYDKAKAAYERLRKEFPDSPFVPVAVEGLGNLAENSNDYQTALTHYKEIFENWPATFTGRRQYLNIGRCQEALGNFKEAKDAYEAQLTMFPGSTVYNDAKQALDRLRAAHPDLFPVTTTAAPEGTASSVEAGPAAALPTGQTGVAALAPAISAPADAPAPAAAQQ